MVDAVGQSCVLSDYNYRNPGFLQKFSVLSGNHGTDENNPVNRIIFKDLHVHHFFVRLVIRAGKKHVIAPFRKDLAYAFCNPADGLGIDLRNHHAHETGLLSPERPGLHGRLISGFLNNFFNPLLLLAADISSVQISGYRGV